MAQETMREPGAQAGSPFGDDDAPEIPQEVLRETPKGAAALAGIAVGLLVLAWLAIYIFVFLPRGMVG